MNYSEVLAIRPFKQLWLGQAVSQLGDALYFLIFLFMVKRLSPPDVSDAYVGYTAALQAIPFLLAGPIAGSVADRMDRRMVMLLADYLSAGLLTLFFCILVVNPAPPVWTLMLAGFMLSMVNVFFLPAKSGALPRLVPADKLMTANALSMATQSFMPMIGLALSGVALGAVYSFAKDWFFPIAVILNAATFLFSALMIAKLPQIMPERDEQEAGHSVWKDSLQGFSFVWKDHLLKVVLLLATAIQFFIAPFMVVYIAANDAWFGGDFKNLAAFEFSFVAAMVVFSLVVGKLNITKPGLAYCYSLAAVGVFVALLAVSRNFWMFMFWNLLCGVALPFAQLPLNTYVQLTVPDSHRGRINSAFGMAVQGVFPLGAALAGLAIKWVGIQGLFVVMGMGIIAVCLIGFFDKAFRSAAMPTGEGISEPV